MNQPTVKDLYDKLEKIEIALIGDERLGIDGTNQRLADTQVTVLDHGTRITKLEGDNKKNKWMTLIKGAGIGFSSGAAIGASKAGAIITKAVGALVAAAGATIFVCYLIMAIIE